MLEWWCHEHETNKFKAICKLYDKEVQVANNGSFALMQHAGMKNPKEKASVRLAFTRKNSILHKEKETVEPSTSSSSEQSRTEIQCSETSQEGIKQVSIKDFLKKKTKQTYQPQMVDKKPESKDNEYVLTVQDQVSKAKTLWTLKTVSENFSFGASDSSPELFQRFLPDSHNSWAHDNK